MTRDELITLLRGWEGDTGDLEMVHIEADDALLAYINDSEITEAYNAIGKWYA